MKKQIALICSILALFCFVSMYMPVIAPRYPAADYYSPAGNDKYFYTGDYYLASEYWNITDFVFANYGVVGRVVLSLDQAMLLLWAVMSVRGEVGKKGRIVALVNVGIVGFFVAGMLLSMWSCRWAVLVVMALNMAASVVMAFNSN